MSPGHPMQPTGNVRQPVVGVLGGMGPQATVEFMRRVIEATPANDDEDHIRMVVDNNPKVPSRIKALIEGTGEDPGPVLATMARGLETAGADFLVIPCNTAHHYLGAVRGAVSIPVLDMIGLTVAQLEGLDAKPHAVGILSSPAVRLTGLIEAACRAANLETVYPEGADDRAVLDVIRAVKAGGVKEELLAAYLSAAVGLAARGAEALVVACTELSVLGGLDRRDGPVVVDTLDALVGAVIARCKPHG